MPRRGAHPLAQHLLTGHPNGGPLTRSPGVTGRLGVIISASSSLPPATIGILTTCGCKFIGGGVEGDSPPLRLTWQLHRLLIWGCWLTPGGWEWLAQGWRHLRSLWQWGLWCLSPQHLSLPFYSGSHLGGPPHRRPVSQGCQQPWGQRGLLTRYAPNGEIWRGEAWRRCHVSRHTSHEGTRIGYSPGRGGHSIPWSLPDNLAP